EQRRARVALAVADALAAAGGDGGGDAVVAIFRALEGAVEDAAGADLALDRDEAAAALRAVGDLAGAARLPRQLDDGADGAERVVLRDDAGRRIAAAVLE